MKTIAITMIGAFGIFLQKLDGWRRSVNSYEGGRSLRPVVGGGGFRDVDVVDIK